MIRNYLIFLFFSLSSSIVVGQTSVYLGPRYPTYGFGDNGIDRFKLNEESVIKSKLRASYKVSIGLDSLHEVFYVDIPDTIDWMQFLEVVPDSMFIIGGPRIVIENSKGYSSRICIYENLIVTIGPDSFMLNTGGLNFFKSLMPIDIRDNWDSLKNYELMQKN